MKRNILWLSFIGLMILQAHCAPSLTPQDSCGFVQNSDGQRVSWKTQSVIKMYFDASVPQQYYQGIQNAIATWEKSIGRHVFEIAGTVSSGTPAQDGVSVIYWLNNWDRGQSQQQANTTIYWVGTTITEADVRINAKNFTFSVQPGYNEVDFESLVLHEFGHVLGLKHVDDAPSVMAKSLSMGYMRRSLYPTDNADIKCEY